VKTATKTLKVPRALETRIARLAKKSGRTVHGFMLDALERQATREEQLLSFVEEALASDAQIDAGGHVYAASDVHAWLERLARGTKAARPKPWRR
jgi:predicted transcriptional regulator